MAKVLGIDPGTYTWDFVGLENSRPVLEKTVKTEEIKREPDRVTKLLKTFGPDLVTGPSGYGLPMKRLGELTSNDLYLITLKKETGKHLGMSNVLGLMRNEKIPAVILPGVKHLSTVPEHRKINRIDMGTPDKVCSAALALQTEAKKSGREYSETSFILAEIGSGFNAFVAVQNGLIVDGIGGTMSSSGMRSSGAIDGELTYLLGDMQKKTLFSGGVKTITDFEKVDNFFNNLDGFREGAKAYEYFVEGIVKDVLRLRISSPEAKKVFLSGRVSKIPKFRTDVGKRLSEFDVVLLEGFAKASNSAQGAAIIADGLAGGKYKDLVEHLRLKDSSGSVFDDIYFEMPGK